LLIALLHLYFVQFSLSQPALTNNSHMSMAYDKTEFNLHDQLQIYGRECHPARWVFQLHMRVHSYHNDLLQHRIISQQL